MEVAFFHIWLVCILCFNFLFLKKTHPHSLSPAQIDVNNRTRTNLVHQVKRLKLLYSQSVKQINLFVRCLKIKTNKTLCNEVLRYPCLRKSSSRIQRQFSTSSSITFMLLPSNTFLLLGYPLCFYCLTLLFLVQREVINLDHINQFEGHIR